jgi:hypothetical protein
MRAPRFSSRTRTARVRPGASNLPYISAPNAAAAAWWKHGPAKARALVPLLIAWAIPASALDVLVKSVGTPASVVTAVIEVRDPLPDRFRKVIDDGGVLHLRLETELWESRPVWDRLVYPAIVRVFRFARAVSGREISIGDSAGATRTYPAVPNPMTLSIELGQSARITATSRYYLRIMATAGTLAEREADDVGDAVFGRASETTGLGSLGRMVLRTMIKVSDYLQSVSAETTGRRISGAELLKP